MPGAEAGSDCGNLLARIPARESGLRRPSRACCCAPTWTPFPCRRPWSRCWWTAAGRTPTRASSGADNKAAVAVLLALARRVLQEGAPVDIELLFTVCEERSLAGARALEWRACAATSATSSTTPRRSARWWWPRLATSAWRPPSAAPRRTRASARRRAQRDPGGGARGGATCRWGAWTQQTTANVGTIAGGSAINVVPERCTLTAEVRSLREEAAEAVVAEMVDCVHEAANLPDCDCDVDVERAAELRRLPHSRERPAVRAAEAALRGCGYEPSADRKRRAPLMPTR